MKQPDLDPLELGERSDDLAGHEVKAAGTGRELDQLSTHRASVHHERSRAWLDGSLAGTEALGLAWVVLPAFIRIATNASIFPIPMSADDAASQVETWLAAPGAVIPQPTPRHASLLSGLIRDTGTRGNLTTDAHLAVLALEHGADLVSYDRDFARSPASGIVSRVSLSRPCS